ncbi:MAG TPA: ribbon-helix-helix protein, CopG family [Chloroflexia bacterium]|nr:ribbon-helix-helix protein, CopG family [Chloroflexia bacterium]
MKDVTISARVPEDLSQQLTTLSEATKRSRSYLIEEALRSYIDEQSWQVAAIKEALEDYQSGNAKLVSHEAVMERLEAKLRAKLER